MAWSRTLLASTAALLLLLASCAQEPPATLPSLIDTTTGIAGIIVGGASTGPVLWGAFDTVDEYNEAYGDVYDFAYGGARPPWAPAGSISVAWGLACSYGLEEAWVVEDGLGDAWDGSDVYFGWDELTFGVGTLRAYDDGTLLLSCPASAAPTGVTVTRHFAVPGVGSLGRFAVEVIAFTGVASGGFDLVDVVYVLDDGADDDMAAPWETYGSVGAFEWATKDDYDTSDPAIGVIPMMSPHFEVDPLATGGDQYYVRSVDDASLAVGERAVVAMVAGIRGGFAESDAAGKDLAMQALGEELALLDGDAICAVGSSGFHVWSKLLDPDGDVLEAICDGYDAL
jgi:hypothetical protein